MPPPAVVGTRKEIKASVEDLINSFIFNPDCTVEGYVPGHSAALALKVPARYRLVSINGTPVADSGELKEVLLKKAAAAAAAAAAGGRSSAAPTTVTAVFVSPARAAPRVSIERSVTYDGAVSGVQPAKAGDVEDLVNTMRSRNTRSPPPPPNLSRARGSAIAAASSAASSVASSALSTAASTPRKSAASSAVTTPRGAGANNSGVSGGGGGNSAAANNSNTNRDGSTAKAEGGGGHDRTASPASSSSGLAAVAAVFAANVRRSTAAPAGNSTNAHSSTNHHNSSYTNSNTGAGSLGRLNLSHGRTSSLSSCSSVGSSGSHASAGTNDNDNGNHQVSDTSEDNTSHNNEGETSMQSMPDFSTFQPLSQRGNGGHEELSDYDRMCMSMGGVRNRSAVTDPKGMSVKQRLSTALSKAKPGRAVICVTQGVNPVAELELLALASQRRLIAFDLGVKLRLRPKPDVLAAQLAEAMRSGCWFALINAHKSINTCTIFEELLGDAHARNLEGFHADSRIIISLEPHPHVPKGLIKDAIVIKLVSNLEGSSIMADSLAASMTRNRLVTADTLSLTMTASGTFAGLSASMTAAAAQRPAKRVVRINAAVDIVDIAPRDVVRVSSSRDAPIDVSGSVALLKNFSGVPGDKFLCVRSAGEEGRFAVGSSMGNVYFLDSLGNSLLQAHAHNASIWDVGFSDKYTFATGCEDGTSAAWQLSSNMLDPDTDDSVLVPTSATSLGADVYCVSYLKNIRPSPLIIGGLHNNLVIRPYVSPEDAAHTAANSNKGKKKKNGNGGYDDDDDDDDESAAGEVYLVAIPLNAQVVDCLPSSSIALVGGGDGSVSVIDVAAAVSLGTLTEHTRKLPALTIRDDNQFFTGSFDSHILSWDLRVPGGVVGGATHEASTMSASTSHTLKLKNYVTGLDVDDVHLAASVGENLYLWDVRKLGTVLGGYPQGWKGLSRGIKVQSDGHLVVTASPDGFVRFWNFV